MQERFAMIKDTEIFRKFENNWIASQKPDLEENLRILDGMYELAVALGKFPGPDPLEGIEKNIRVARILNRVQSPY
jgi:hypothetical protein